MININEIKSLNELFNINNDNKIIICISLFLLFILYYKSLYLIIGFIFSYNLYYFYSAKKTGDYSFMMLKNNYIHIHHWLYCLLLLLLSLYYEYLFFIGFFYGGVVHGIQYSDWLNIIN